MRAWQQEALVTRPPEHDRGSDRRQAMLANVGDELLIKGRHVGDEDREGVIIEIHGENGAQLVDLTD
jgi:hypothetical protein